MPPPQYNGGGHIALEGPRAGTRHRHHSRALRLYPVAGQAGAGDRPRGHGQVHHPARLRTRGFGRLGRARHRGHRRPAHRRRGGRVRRRGAHDVAPTTAAARTASRRSPPRWTRRDRGQRPGRRAGDTARAGRAGHPGAGRGRGRRHGHAGPSHRPRGGVARPARRQGRARRGRLRALLQPQPHPLPARLRRPAGRRAGPAAAPPGHLQLPPRLPAALRRTAALDRWKRPRSWSSSARWPPDTASASPSTPHASIGIDTPADLEAWLDKHRSHKEQ